MKFLFANLCLQALWFGSAVWAAQIPFQNDSGGFTANPSVQLRVRVAQAQLKTQLRGLDLQVNGRALRGQNSVKVSCSPRGVILRDSRDNWIGQSKKVEIQSRAEFIWVGTHEYRGMLTIDSKTQCDLVNHMDLEKYLDGLVNAEFSASWGEAAIIAQVVAARTYAFNQMNRYHSSRHYDLDSTTQDQVYDGSLKEDHRAAVAAARSRGVVLVDTKSKQVMKVFYHSTCGGRTELAQNVWAGDSSRQSPGQVSVKCPYCKDSPHRSWETLVPKAVLFPVFQARFRSARVASISELKLNVQSVTDSGRVRVAALSLGGQTVKLSAQELRAAVGFGELKSTFVSIKKDLGSAWVIEGHGYGHGVGLCQYGARAMADQGKSALEILKWYYPRATMTKLW